MDTNYKIAFEKAIVRTSKNGLICPPFIAYPSPMITDERKDMLAKLITDFNTREKGDVVASQCVDFNMKLKTNVEEFFGAEVYLTSGGLATDNNVQLSNLTEESIRTLLDSPIRLSQNERIQFHTWLTLPTYEVLDLTLATSLAKPMKRPDFLHQIWAGFPSKLRYVYQPMMVGEDFLKKSGAFAGWRS